LPTRATVPIRTLALPHYGARIAVLLGAALAVAPAPVLAEMQVSGSAEAVTIQAGDASLEEILAALNRAFGVRYELSVNLDKSLSGTYEGSLPEVLKGILNGYNFVLYTDKGALAVTVAGIANAPGTSPGRPASSSAQVVRHPSPAAPTAQAPVSFSGVKKVARKGPPSLLESVAEESGAPAPAPPPETTSSTAAPQQGPSTAAPAPQPIPSTVAPQPMPSTTLQPRPFTAVPRARPSTAAP
jgi:hypothetical protein